MVAVTVVSFLRRRGFRTLAAILCVWNLACVAVSFSVSFSLLNESVAGMLDPILIPLRVLLKSIIHSDRERRFFVLSLSSHYAVAFSNDRTAKRPNTPEAEVLH